MTEILVGVDGNAGTDDALAFAARLAEPTGAALRLVSAYPYDPHPSVVTELPGDVRAVSLGGVTHALVRAAACPVIVLPRGSGQEGLDLLLAPAEEASTP
jgi:nucleotide-binding universal stress UspA family protein